MRTTVIPRRARTFDPREVYVGRSFGHQHFGNPFSHRFSGLAVERVATVREAVDCFERWLLGDPRWAHVEPDRREWILARVPALKGKILVCYGCSPCHADVLARLADAS